MNDYRKRVYESYVSTWWRFTHTLTEEEYKHQSRVWRRRLSSFLPEDKDAKMIDLACGSGHFLYFIQNQGYTQAQGLDLSEQQVDSAREAGVNNVEVGDLFQVLPDHKGEFDFVSANEIIEHLNKNEVLGFLDLVYAALNPGGGVLITTPNADSLFGAQAGAGDFTHETAFTPGSLGQVLRVCGFEEVSMRGEEPVAHSLGSAVRAIAWKLTKGLIKAYLLIDGSMGFGIWKKNVVLEPRIIAIGRKPRK